MHYGSTKVTSVYTKAQAILIKKKAGMYPECRIEFGSRPSTQL